MTKKWTNWARNYSIDTHLDFDVANSSDQRTYSQLNILDAKIVRFLLSPDQQLL